MSFKQPNRLRLFLFHIKEFAAKEKLEIVKDRGEAANFLGASPRCRRRRNASELFSVYAGLDTNLTDRLMARLDLTSSRSWNPRPADRVSAVFMVNGIEPSRQTEMGQKHEISVFRAFWF